MWSVRAFRLLSEACLCEHAEAKEDRQSEACEKWVGREEETTNMHVEESVVINRPPEEVFDYVTNRQNLPEWSRPVQEVHSETKGPSSKKAPVSPLWSSSWVGLSRRPSR